MRLGVAFMDDQRKVSPNEVRAMQAELDRMERESPHHPEIDALRNRLQIAYLELGVQEFGGHHADESG